MGKADEERLRRRITTLEAEHAKQIAAKNRVIEQLRTGSVLFDLGATFPAFPDLVAWLHKAHVAAAILRSPTGDGRSHGTPTPYEQGAPTRGDRARASAINDQIERLITFISDRFAERGPLNEPAPVCWNPNCSTRGWPQPFEAETCRSCGDDFTAHRYKPTLVTSRRRCKIRDCHGRDKVGTCVHSA